jgi:hypothetical protein
MKMLKTVIAAASLVLISAQALAFTPPYHISGAAYTGKATIQSSGGCSVKETFVDAQYGGILDDTNTYVGWGMVSANGQILVVENDYSKSYYFYDSATNNSVTVYYEDMTSQFTVEAIQSFAKPAGCTIRNIVPGAKSNETYTVTVSKGLDQISLQYIFSGFTEFAPTVVKGTKSYDKTKNFSGKITFKGARPLAV